MDNDGSLKILGGTHACPACLEHVVIAISVDSRVILAYDPVPGTSMKHRIRLTDDRKTSLGRDESGRPAYREHAWSCVNRLQVPAGGTVPPWGGYWRG